MIDSQTGLARLVLFADPKEGLAWMVSQKKTFKAMSVEKGTKGVATPLHPGAEKFWKEMGIVK